MNQSTPPPPNQDGIALIGMGCRFPGANNLDQFWHNLQNGIESLTHFSDEELAASGIDPAMRSNPNYVKAGAILEDVAGFDADFFGINAAEATLMDPQHRLLLECAWEALENSGYAPDTIDGAVGVYAGSRISEYLLFNQPPPDLVGLDDGSLITNFQRLVGNDKDYLATRISFKLNLTGPSLTIQTACSTSLVAIHLACESLLNGECDLALAGGVSIRVPQKAGYLHSQGMIFSADGHTRAFDANASGTIFSSGAGLVTLKCLEDAVADGDNIYAVIRGSALNNDGAAGKAGYTAPSQAGQAEVIAQAMEVAEVEPETVTYIETHGTGTALGDVIEVAALTDVFRAQTEAKNFCALGAVKSNIGHTVQAAGVAGLIKTALMLKHQCLVPSPNFEQPNPQLQLEDSPFYINTQLTDWPTNGTPRRAGISSFGVGGTNAHVILEEMIPIEPRQAEVNRTTHLLTLSAKNKAALKELANLYGQRLIEIDSDLADVCFTANLGRTHFPERLAIIADSAAEMSQKLAAFTADDDIAGIISTPSEAITHPKIAFIFTGQGSQYINMGRHLYHTQPVFRDTLNHCATILDNHLDHPLLTILYPDLNQPQTTPTQPHPTPPNPQSPISNLQSPISQSPNLQSPVSNLQSPISSLQSPISNPPSPINQTAFTQPALFAIEYALARLWQSWGIQPEVVMGHSVGEYVAACLAGVFSLEDGLRLIAARGRLMQALPAGGTMAAIFADETRVTAAIEPYTETVAIAAINGPENIVISGVEADVQAIVEQFQAEGVRTQALTVSHAFHSPLMLPMLEEFEEIAATIDYAAPTISLISNLTGQVQTTAPDAAYWRQHVRQSVQFSAAMRTLHEQGGNILIEIGPQPTLLGMGRRCWPDGSGLWLPSLRKGQPDEAQLWQSLATLYVHQVEIDWAGFETPFAGQRIPLPTYPFQRQRYWLEPTQRQSTRHQPRAAGHPLLGERLPSPLREMQFQQQISVTTPAFLTDHRVYDTPTFPATAYIEMVCAAAIELFGGGAGSIVVQELVIQQALLLNEESDTNLQLILTPEGDQAAAFQIFSQSASDETTWQQHASGQLRLDSLVEPETISETISLETVQANCLETVSTTDFYQWKQARGLQHGPQFQGVVEISRDEANSQSLGHITQPDQLAPDTAYYLHPALLDACLQIGEVAFADYGDPNNDSLYLPMLWERITIYDRLQPPLWSQATGRSEGQGQVRTLDLRLLDETGRVLVEIEGLHFKQASRKSLQMAMDGANLLHEVVWQAAPLTKSSPLIPTAQDIGQWLIFADAAGLGQQVAEMLLAQGHDCQLIWPGQTYNVTNQGYIIDPTQPSHFDRLLDRLDWTKGRLLYLWGLNDNHSTNISTATLQTSCSGLLHLTQALTAHEQLTATRLWIVTRGSQTTGAEFGPVAVSQAPLWGLGRVIMREQSQLQPTLLDLDPTGGESEAATLLASVFTQDAEQQIAWRAKERYVARLVNRQTKPTSSQLELPDYPYELDTTQRGVLENLTLRPQQRRSPGPGEVEIQIYATGLNFRDVLNALGQLSGYIGRECSGVVVACGEGVTDFNIGDAVVAVFAYDSFSSFVTVDARFVAPKPAHLTFEAAATIPIVFLTTYYCLHHIADMTQAKRILIHAASGGVGLAALQLAQQANLDVYGTASRPKWAYMKSLGVQHILNSRTLEFADEIITLTDGEGVDIVLNSLTGDFIPKSLSVVSPNGTFLELGATGSWTEAQVAELRPDVAYTEFHLRHVPEEDIEAFQVVFRRLMQDFEQGLLKPLPQRVFPIEATPHAFRTMAQAKHIGKIVISNRRHIPPAEQQATPAFTANKTYLLTGGLGGLGLKLAAWLVEQGARHLALMGRRAPGEAAQKAIAAMEAAGVQVVVVQADVTQAEQVAHCLATIEQTLPPLRGIVHAAGVLDDGLLTQQNWARFERVLQPKVAGAWQLHSLTIDQPLDFFVLFSSSAALLGGPGQGNYAAANAFLDGLAHYRRSRGLTAVSINWGAWAEVGMAANLAAPIQQQRAAQGMGQIEPAQGLDLLRHILDQDEANIGVLPLEWPKYLRQFANVPPFFSALARRDSGPAKSERSTPEADTVLQRLQTTPPADHYQLLLTHIQSKVARVLAVTNTNLAVDRSLLELGIDSLMALELRNRITTDLKVDIPIVKFIEGPTIAQLTQLLLELMGDGSNGNVQPEDKVSNQPYQNLTTDDDWEEGEL